MKWCLVHLLRACERFFDREEPRFPGSWAWAEAFGAIAAILDGEDPSSVFRRGTPMDRR